MAEPLLETYFNFLLRRGRASVFVERIGHLVKLIQRSAFCQTFFIHSRREVLVRPAKYQTATLHVAPSSWKAKALQNKNEHMRKNEKTMQNAPSGGIEIENGTFRGVLKYSSHAGDRFWGDVMSSIYGSNDGSTKMRPLSKTSMVSEEEMTTPIRINCSNLAGVPSVSDIKAKLATERHVVLQFPVTRRVDKQPLIAELSAALPECSVFDSGGDSKTDWLTIMPVIDIETVRSHEQEIREAADTYIQTCSCLVAQLASENLPPEWAADVHGLHCRFENSTTGQVVEAPLTGTTAPENLDPYFFAQFVKSTSSCAAVAQLIKDDFHDARRMLRVIFGDRTSIW
jgi:hypothetical protein